MDRFDVFDSHPDVVLIIGPDLTITHANAAVGPTLGYQLGELIGRPVASLVPETERPDVADAIAAVVDGAARSRPALFSVLHARGEFVAVEALAKPVPNGLLVSLRLRDDRDRTQEERRQLERLIALTAAECLDPDPVIASRAVELAVSRYQAAIGASRADLLLDGLHTVGSGDGPGELPCEAVFDRSRYVTDDDPTASVDDRTLLRDHGIVAYSEVRLSDRAGVFRTGWSGQSPKSVYPYLLRALGDILVGTLRRLDALTRLSDIATRDALTGLLNRGEFHRRTNSVPMADDRRSGAPSTVVALFIDLDGFKRVNDRYGHSIGDRVLIEASNRIREVVRHEDLVTRMGGDEFVVVAELADRGAAIELRDRLQQRLDESYVVGGAMLEVGASVGMALETFEHSRGSIDDLVRRADAAMYQEKSQRRARTRMTA